MKPNCWNEWAAANGWYHIGYFKGKPLLCKVPEYLWNRLAMNMGITP